MNFIRTVVRVAQAYPRAALATVGLGVLLKTSHSELYRFEKEIVAKDKFVKVSGDKTKYMIISDEGDIFSFENSAWRLHWARAELWAEIEKGEKYRISGTGIRWPYAGWHRRVFSATKVI